MLRINRVDKVFRMLVSIESRDVVIYYRFIIFFISGSEYGIVIFTVKRFVIFFMKVSFIKWLIIICIDKMFWMLCLV